MTTFTALHLSETLLRTLAEEGYTTPTPIQAQTITPALEGRDVLGCAQTGTGKTAAFALPIIQQLMSQPRPSAPEGQPGGRRQSRGGATLPRALILSPTRELANQICESFGVYGRGTRLRHTAIYGGVSQRGQERALRQGVDIIVATPGRLMDLMEQRVVDLSAVEIFTLDEADRMLDMGFIDPIRRIAKALTARRQTLLFSATMPPKVATLANSLLNNPVKVSVAHSASADPNIEEVVYKVGRHDKQALLEHLLQGTGVGRAIVFTRTKHGAEKVKKKLTSAGVSADAIHGNKNQNQRQRALDGFRRGHSQVLVATDVAARGLDVDGVTHIFNFDLPVEPEAYVHRIGRTARAGASGQAIAFCSPDERQMLGAIERFTGKRLALAKAEAGATAGAQRADERQRDDRRAVETVPAGANGAPRIPRPAGGGGKKPRGNGGPTNPGAGGPSRRPGRGRPGAGAGTGQKRKSGGRPSSRARF